MYDHRELARQRRLGTLLQERSDNVSVQPPLPTSSPQGALQERSSNNLQSEEDLEDQWQSGNSPAKQTRRETPGGKDRGILGINQASVKT